MHISASWREQGWESVGDMKVRPGWDGDWRVTALLAFTFIMSCTINMIQVTSVTLYPQRINWRI